MKTRIILFGAGSVFAVAAIGIALWAGSAAEKARSDRTLLSKRSAELNLRLRRAGERLAKAEKSLSPTPAGSRGQSNATASVLASALSRDLRDERIRAQLGKDPELQNRLVAWQRSELAVKFGPFFRAMKLSPEQIERLSDAWAQNIVAMFDLSTIMKEQKLSSKDAAIVAQRAKAEADVRAVEEEVLGVEGCQNLLHYRRTQSMRDVVARLAGKAALSDAPINSEQAEQLTEILAESVPSFRSSGLSTPNFDQVNWEAASAAARTVLTPAQYELFMLEGEQSRARSALTKALFAAQRAQSAKPGKPEARR